MARLTATALYAILGDTGSNSAQVLGLATSTGALVLNAEASSSEYINSVELLAAPGGRLLVRRFSSALGTSLASLSAASGAEQWVWKHPSTAYGDTVLSADASAVFVGSTCSGCRSAALLGVGLSTGLTRASLSPCPASLVSASAAYAAAGGGGGVLATFDTSGYGSEGVGAFAAASAGNAALWSTGCEARLEYSGILTSTSVLMVAAASSYSSGRVLTLLKLPVTCPPAPPTPTPPAVIAAAVLGSLFVCASLVAAIVKQDVIKRELGWSKLPAERTALVDKGSSGGGFFPSPAAFTSNPPTLLAEQK